MKKATGWVIVIIGVAWALWVLLSGAGSERGDTSSSYLIGALILPVLVSLVGLWLAGVIKSAK